MQQVFDNNRTGVDATTWRCYWNVLTNYCEKVEENDLTAEKTYRTVGTLIISDFFLSSWSNSIFTYRCLNSLHGQAPRDAMTLNPNDMDIDENDPSSTPTQLPDTLPEAYFSLKRLNARRNVMKGSKT
jgi:hypothetical protein